MDDSRVEMTEGPAGVSIAPTGRGSEQRPGVLVLNDGQSRYGQLPLTCRETTVWELTGDTATLAPPPGPFASILVDRSPLDLVWLDRVLSVAVASLAPDGRVLIRLDPDGERAQRPASPTFDGLAWDGLELVSERVCAVLRPGRSASPIAELLVASHSAVRLASAAGQPVARAGLTRAGRVLADQLEERYRSERGLLDQLERLLVRTDAARRPSTLPALLRRSPITRPARALLRRVRKTG